MAQVNSEPGKNQVFANLAVPASQASTQSNTGVGLVPAQASQVLAVSYGQIEPGAPNDKSQRPQRS
jgi:hypothetical protein